MEKFICKSEGCEMPHCRKCGSHYDLYAAYGKDVCDHCQIFGFAEETRAITEQFGGNYEEAANWMGW